MNDYPYMIFHLSNEDGNYPWVAIKSSLATVVGYENFQVVTEGFEDLCVAFYSDEDAAKAKMFFNDNISESGLDSVMNIAQKVKPYY